MATPDELTLFASEWSPGSEKAIWWRRFAQRISTSASDFVSRIVGSELLRVCSQHLQGLVGSTTSD